MKRVFVYLVITVLLWGCASDSELVAFDSASYYTIAWISDTQNLVDHNNDAFESMMIYLKNNQQKEDIRFLIHTGDVINIYSIESQWQNARKAFDIIEDKIDHTIIAGNHDLANDNKYFIEYFGKQDNMTYDNGLASADIVEGDKLEYLIISLSYDPSDEMLNWANKMIMDHPDKIVIVDTHSYLNIDGSLTSIGENIYQKLISKHDNIRLVLCGHIHGIYSGINNDVISLLCDYQQDDSAYIRLLRIDEDSKRLDVISYDPFVNKYDETNNRSFDISCWFK